MANTATLAGGEARAVGVCAAQWLREGAGRVRLGANEVHGSRGGDELTVPLCVRSTSQTR
jgi:hypothetical protein